MKLNETLIDSCMVFFRLLVPCKASYSEINFGRWRLSRVKTLEGDKACNLAAEEIEKKLIYQDPSPFRWDFQYFCVNSSLKWRRSRLTAAKLQALSPSYVLTRLNRHRPEGEKTPYMSRLRFSFNFIEIFRPRCDLDVQFSELYS